MLTNVPGCMWKYAKTLKKNSEPKGSLILKTGDNNQAGRINLLGDTK